MLNNKPVKSVAMVPPSTTPICETGTNQHRLPPRQQSLRHASTNVRLHLCENFIIRPIRSLTATPTGKVEITIRGKRFKTRKQGLTINFHICDNRGAAYTSLHLAIFLARLFECSTSGDCLVVRSTSRYETLDECNSRLHRCKNLHRIEEFASL